MCQSNVILDPTAPHASAARQSSWRLDGLHGKVVGFVDNAKPNFNTLVYELADVLVARHGVARVVKSFPDTMLIVDTVSSLSTVPTPMDELGIDVLLAGVQKALALPPGLSVFACSQAALERAEAMPNRGYYFDFIEFAKNAEKAKADLVGMQPWPGLALTKCGCLPP